MALSKFPVDLKSLSDFVLSQDWKDIPQKVKSNRGIVVTCAIASIGSLWIIKRALASDSQCNEEDIPDWTYPHEEDIQLEKRLQSITKRRNKRSKMKNGNRKGDRQKSNSKDERIQEGNEEVQVADEERNEKAEGNEEYLDMDDDADQGFSVDEFYVPGLRIRPAQTRRNSTGPFMRLFEIYAKEPSIDNSYIHPSQASTAASIHSEALEDMNEEAMDEMEYKQASPRQELGPDADEPYPFNDTVFPSDTYSEHPISYDAIPPYGVRAEKEQPPLSTLDRLKEMYSTKNIPKSLQPDTLSLQLDRTKKLDGTGGLFGGIRNILQ